jgi:hypothetical protein
MSGECEKCGEHCLECNCLDTHVCAVIEEKIEKIYEKYKPYPQETMHALQTFMNVLDEDRYARMIEKENEKLARNPTMYLDIDGNLEKFKDSESPVGEEIEPGYICRLCAVKLNAVPPKFHVSTWHRGKCDFCGEEANLCHTSDWSWPDKPYLEEGREF